MIYYKIIAHFNEGKKVLETVENYTIAVQKMLDYKLYYSLFDIKVVEVIE